MARVAGCESRWYIDKKNEKKMNSVLNRLNVDKVFDVHNAITTRSNCHLKNKDICPIIILSSLCYYTFLITGSLLLTVPSST